MAKENGGLLILGQTLPEFAITVLMTVVLALSCIFMSMFLVFMLFEPVLTKS